MGKLKQPTFKLVESQIAPGVENKVGTSRHITVTSPALTLHGVKNPNLGLFARYSRMLLRKEYNFQSLSSDSPSRDPRLCKTSSIKSWKDASFSTKLKAHNQMLLHTPS